MIGTFLVIGFFTIQFNLHFGHALEIQTFKVSSSSTEYNASSCWRSASTTVRHCGVVPKVRTQELPSFMAAFGEFPWQVAIIDRYEQTFLCSGVLIGSRTVITATKCVGGILLTDIRVRVGDWDIINDEHAEEPFGSEDIPVVKKYFYSDLNMHGSQFSMIDEAHIAILKLKSPVNFDLYPHVSQICLPSRDILNYSSLTNCYTAGWSDSAVQSLRTTENARAQTSNKDGIIIENSNSCTEGFSVKTTDETFCLNNYLNFIREEPSHVKFDNTPIVNCDESKLMMHLEDTTSSLASEDTEFVEEENNADSTNEGESYGSSRVLNKAAVTLASRTECIATLGNDTLDLKSTNLCIFPSGNSQPCKADVGAPVICQIEQPPLVQKENLYSSQNKQSLKSSWKSAKKPKDETFASVPQYILVAIVSRSYACLTQDNLSPLVAVSIPRMLDFICRIAGDKF